jgi:hypothetical protein
MRTARTTYSNLGEAVFRSQVKVCVALFFVVWIAQVAGVVANNALHKRQIVE